MSLQATQLATPTLDRQKTLRFAIPSDRQMEGDTLDFLANCGLRVKRASPRQYTGTVAAVPGLSVIFQRSVDIPGELDEGAIDLGLLGYERYLEDRKEPGQSTVVIDDLGYSKTDLVIAVPNAWAEVNSVADLAVFARRRGEGKELRVATKYHRQVKRFLDTHSVGNYRLVHINGAIEAAPLIGTADVISDLSSSGGTLRENNLKTLSDGTITRSAACLVANKTTLRGSPAKLKQAKMLFELIEARLRAEGFFSIIANIRGESMEAVAQRVTLNPDVAGMQGPTIARVVSKQGTGDWWSVSVVVPISRLTHGIDHLRKIGCSGVVVFPAHYVFGGECLAYERLVKALG